MQGAPSDRADVVLVGMQLPCLGTTVLPMLARKQQITGVSRPVGDASRSARSGRPATSVTDGATEDAGMVHSVQLMLRCNGL